MIEKIGLFFLLFVLIIGISSCKNEESPKQLANDFCDCIVSGINLDILTGNYDFTEIAKKLNKTSREKLINTLKIFKETMETMTGEGRKNFLKEFLKELLETDCADIALSFIYYGELLNEIDNAINVIQLTSPPHTVPKKDSTASWHFIPN
jgi:hypothetical protein